MSEKRINFRKNVCIENYDNEDILVVVLSDNVKFGIPLTELDSVFKHYGYILQKKDLSN